MDGFRYADDEGLWMWFRRYSHVERGKPDIVLLPTSHLADSLFFEEADYEVWASDTILLEGLRPPGGGFLARCYRLYGRLFGMSHEYETSSDGADTKSWTDWHRSGEDDPWQREFKIDHTHQGYPLSRRVVRFVHADVEWSTLPISWQTTIFFSVAMLLAPFQGLFENRGSYIDGLPDVSEMESGDGFFDRQTAAFMNAALHARDENLIRIVTDEVARPSNAGKIICIKYGEAHMRALSDHIVSKLGYHCSEERAVLAIAREKTAANDPQRACYGIGRKKFWDRYGPPISALRASSRESAAAAEGKPAVC